MAKLQILRHIRLPSTAILLLAVLSACTSHENSHLHNLQEALVEAATSIGSSGRTGVYVGCMWAHEFLEVLPQLVCFHLQVYCYYYYYYTLLLPRGKVRLGRKTTGLFPPPIYWIQSLQGLSNSNRRVCKLHSVMFLLWERYGRFYQILQQLLLNAPSHCALDRLVEMNIM